MNFQVTVLKILVSYPDGFAAMADLKRDMAILATSGRDWADRTKRLAARVPELDIFSQGLVARESGGWKITVEGRRVLEFMEARPVADLAMNTVPPAEAPLPLPPLPHPAERARRRRERRERAREARERARATASSA
ncbi:hypothetical protein ABIB75_008054 [Bradyrhizobium sp. GM2.2]|uniref:hypothetical protein n=1 Tax=unclassified Bradyrhizobium TaxID=2631580 RepID=UPI001FFAD9EA|nr:hypothetical protein [Bradyrhizobium sp. 145]